MNSYRLRDLVPGMKDHFGVEVTAEMMAKFLDITGDSNPLHTDTEFAQAAGYQAPVAYGILTASFYSTLVGVHLPGRYVLLHGIDVSFAAPVFAGDRLTVYGEISAVHLELKLAEMRAHIVNQHGQKVSRAKIRIGVRE
jgi:3-hydroxybutyryl-CoA dehydratase